MTTPRAYIKARLLNFLDERPLFSPWVTCYLLALCEHFMITFACVLHDAGSFTLDSTNTANHIVQQLLLRPHVSLTPDMTQSFHEEPTTPKRYSSIIQDRYPHRGIANRRNYTQLHYFVT